MSALANLIIGLATRAQIYGELGEYWRGLRSLFLFA